MEKSPVESSSNRLQSLTFKLNDFLDGVGWIHCLKNPDCEVRQRVHSLDDGKVINARQFRTAETENVFGCIVDIIDKDRLIPHVLRAQWQPLDAGEYEFGIEDTEEALEKALNEVS